MRKQQRIIAVGIACLATAALLTACTGGSDGTQGNETTDQSTAQDETQDFLTGPPESSAPSTVFTGEKSVVAFVPRIQGEPYGDAVNAGAKLAETALGSFEWKSQGPATADASAQADIVTSFIDQGVDVLLVEPVSADALAPQLQAAADAGIKVGTVTSDAPSSPRSVFVEPVSSDAIAQGLIDAVMNPMGSAGKFGIVSCDEADPTLTQWLATQNTYVASAYPEAEPVDVVFAGQDAATATQMAKDLMAAHPDMTGLLGECPTATAGVAQAVRDNGKIGQVFAVGVGTPMGMKPFLDDGSAVSALFWDAGQLGYLTAWTGAQLGQGEELQASNNVSETLPAVKYDDASKALLLGPPPGTHHRQRQRLRILTATLANIG